MFARMPSAQQPVGARGLRNPQRFQRYKETSAWTLAIVGISLNGPASARPALPATEAGRRGRQSTGSHGRRGRRRTP
jgi:hypothetical protein